MSHRRLFRLLAGSSAAGLFLITAGPALACFSPPPPCPGLTITTKAASGTAGQPIDDVATLSGGNKPSGTITWTVYSASDKWCSKPLYTTASVPVNGDGNYTSPGYTPAAPGSYQWVASFSGGGRDNDVATKCNDANEVSTVSKAIPSLSTTATPSAPVGQAINDSAVLSGGDSPTGSITWSVYAAGTSCVAPLFTTGAVAVNGDGAYASPSYIPQATGTYQWVATYSGDSNNSAFTSPCSDTSEQSVASKASPSLSTNATASATVGQPISDTATLSGGDSPSGSITWSVYPAGSCVTPLFTTSAVTVNGDGTYSSPSYMPQTPGTYEWLATYSGDANNQALTSSCSDTSEQSVVKAAPSSPPPTSTSTPPAPSSPPSGKQTVRSTKVLRCGPEKVKKHKTVHGKSVTVCVAKKKRAIVTRRPLPSFTG
jgi:hypothetical protein